MLGTDGFESKKEQTRSILWNTPNVSILEDFVGRPGRFPRRESFTILLGNLTSVVAGVWGLIGS